MEIHKTVASESPLVSGQIKGKPKQTLLPGMVQRLMLNQPLDVAIARTTVRKLADALGYSLIDQVRLSSATFEIADRIVTHAGRGEIVIFWREETRRKGLQLFCNDQGLHTSKLTTDLQSTNGKADSKSTPNLKKLVDEFELSEDPQYGICVTMTLWLE